MKVKKGITVLHHSCICIRSFECPSASVPWQPEWNTCSSLLTPHFNNWRLGEEGKQLRVIGSLALTLWDWKSGKIKKLGDLAIWQCMGAYRNNPRRTPKKHGDSGRSGTRYRLFEVDQREIELKKGLRFIGFFWIASSKWCVVRGATSIRANNTRDWASSGKHEVCTNWWRKDIS